MTNQWQNSRKLSSILIFKANLKLTSPALFGSGEREGVSDITVLRDEESGYPLLSGSTVAGVIRNYLCELSVDSDSLFGGIKTVDETDIARQSYLIIDESLAAEVPEIERRDNVAINHKTRVAEDKHKFDYEVLAKGTIFPISMELLIPQETNSAETIRRNFLECVNGLLKNRIPIGAKTSRGLGTCVFEDWKVFVFNFEKNGILPWLKYNTLNESTWEAQNPDKVEKPETIEDFARILGLKEFEPAAVNPNTIELTATFMLKSSLLIRSQDETIADKTKAPETRHLHRKVVSKSGRSDEPIISGTSLAGVLRHRAQKILRTQGKSEKEAEEAINELFGHPGIPDGKTKTQAQASRFIVKECIIEQEANTASEFVQSRVAIDRFTSGAADNKLFTEQALFKAANQSLTVNITIKKAKEKDFNLLLLLLLDLWTGDLPIGSGANIGRGLLRGRCCEVSFKGKTWHTDTPYDEKGSLVLIQKEKKND